MPDLSVEVLDAELIRVSMRRGSIEVATFVTSHHLAPQKEAQLLAALERIEAEKAAIDREAADAFNS